MTWQSKVKYDGDIRIKPPLAVGLGEAFCWIASFIRLHRQDVVFVVAPWAWS